jgi:hypothetical protein
VATNIDMARVFPAHGIDGHRNTGEVILIDKRRLILLNTEIAQNSADINNLLASKAGSHIFSL